ncbi:MAG: fumarylacetoacetate hydrolase family protein [Gammaproteobacteria bacterium]|nr:fumarylacetoacetate hydrolase family protein [Gammaproteobacteria bacterium]
MNVNAADTVEFQPNAAALVDQGMHSQLRALDAELDGGAPRIGWKIGITTAAARRPHGLTAPVIGRLDGRRAFASGASVPLAGSAKVRAEGEMALRVDRALDANATVADARAAICGVGPAIEFINLHMPKDDISTILAHSIFHEAVIFGPELPPAALADGKDLWPVGRRNTKCVRTPEPAMIPTDLPALILLVARTLSRYGRRIEAGDRIISGSFIVPLVVEPGDLIEVDFGFLGKVTARTRPA